MNAAQIKTLVKKEVADLRVGFRQMKIVPNDTNRFADTLPSNASFPQSILSTIEEIPRSN
jgi:hypothetical protein